MVEIISMVLNDMQRTQANLSMMSNPPGGISLEGQEMVPEKINVS